MWLLALFQRKNRHLKGRLIKIISVRRLVISESQALEFMFCVQVELKVACHFLRKGAPDRTAFPFVVCQSFGFHSVIYTTVPIYRVLAAHRDLE